METGTPEQRELIREAIKTARPTSPRLAQAIQATDALAHARQAATEKRGRTCPTALSAFPVSLYQKSLLEFCAFSRE
ncbi:hypothetical protein ACL7B0_04185 [Bordetella pertussis]